MAVAKNNDSDHKSSISFVIMIASSALTNLITVKSTETESEATDKNYCEQIAANNEEMINYSRRSPQFKRNNWIEPADEK